MFLMFYCVSHYVIVALIQINIYGHKVYIQIESLFLNAQYKRRHLYCYSLPIPTQVESMDCSSPTRDYKCIRIKASSPFSISLPAQSTVSCLTH